MNKTKLLILSCLALVLFAAMFSVAIAKSNNSTEKKMNHGLCVSNCTIAKKTCFKEAMLDFKDSKLDIRNSSINKSEKKELTKSALLNFTLNLKECKVEFKKCKDSCVQYKCKENEVFLNQTCRKTCLANADCKKNEICLNDSKICVHRQNNSTKHYINGN
jgi:hypothetical protein